MSRTIAAATRTKISRSLMGNTNSAGRKLSQATRDKLSRALQGNDNGAMLGRAQRASASEVEVCLREVGRIIRDHRLAADVSLKDLAAAAGVSEFTIIRIEHGKTRRSRNLGATCSVLIRIALALGVRPYQLFT